MKRMSIGFLLAVMIVFCWTFGIAGDFYVVPVKGQYKSWDSIIEGSARFKLVLKDNEAVLDRETGLVWQRDTDTTQRTWSDAVIYCYGLNVGGRKGWRLPTIEELSTLVDKSKENPALPAGHLFTNARSHYYWSSTTNASNTSSAWVIYFHYGTGDCVNKSSSYYVRAVRGGHGYDAR